MVVYKKSCHKWFYKKNMVFSKYNFLFESSKYGCLLYNSVSNAFIRLDRNSFEELKKIEQDSTLINKLSDSSLKKLKEAKVIVTDDNQFFYNKRMNFYFNTFDAVNLGLAIAPTTHCNFSCSYCYEGSRKPIYMTPEVEKEIIKFIKRYERVKNLNLTWYGGEPLMGFESIKRLLFDIKEISDIKLCHHTMTSNGYLLTREKSLFFRDYPLTCIQITIDGNKQAHDNRRTLAPNRMPTYDVIVENIEQFIDLNPDTRVAIRANLDHSNSETFIEIFKELSDRWKGRNVIVYPAFVKDFQSLNRETNKDNFAANGCRDICFTTSEKMQFFEKLHKKYGLEVNFRPEYTVGGCGATIVNYFVIGPKGELYKCWNDIGDENFIVGNVVENKITNYELLSRYIGGPNMMDDPKSCECKLFPICDGGCAWNRHKNIFNGASMQLCSSRISNPEKAFELYYEQLIK